MKLPQEQEVILLFLLGVVLVYSIYLLSLLVPRKRSDSPFRLTRHPKNPILEPREEHFWEAEAVFNPTVLYDGERVHMLYRAIGRDGVSRVGYASSIDGIHFDERLPYPVYELHTDPQARKACPVGGGKRHYHPGISASGGSMGGCEDPRMVCIDDEVHMTFTAFLGWHAIRMAITSVSHVDFLKQEWNWGPLSFLSHPEEVHKNWVIFPEKINGKYAVLHDIDPTIQIHYVDSVDELYDETRYIESAYERQEREGVWDNFVRGAGAPPLKTDEGWLLIYHGHERHEPHRYKVGVMLLDLNEPSRVLYRAPLPLLAPDTWYENRGKPGVVYASGAIVKDDELLVYYGGGDTSVNIASTPLKQFMKELKKHPEIC